MTLEIGYARVSTDDQDLTAQRDALAALGVASEPRRPLAATFRSEQTPTDQHVRHALANFTEKRQLVPRTPTSS